MRTPPPSVPPSPGPVTGLSTTETGKPPPPLVICTVALAAEVALAVRYCPACAHITVGGAEAEAGPHKDLTGAIVVATECPGAVAWEALADVTGLRRR